MREYRKLNTTISFPIFELTTPFGKPTEAFLGLPYQSNVISDKKIIRLIEYISKFGFNPRAIFGF